MPPQEREPGRIPSRRQRTPIVLTDLKTAVALGNFLLSYKGLGGEKERGVLFGWNKDKATFTGTAHYVMFDRSTTPLRLTC